MKFKKCEVFPERSLGKKVAACYEPHSGLVNGGLASQLA
jgi:hypothetical protein